jgi:hypothetical protein
MKPEERSRNAGLVLRGYIVAKGECYGEPTVDDATDLLSDLMHWLRVEKGVSPSAIDEEIVRRARTNFLKETDEEEE